MRRQLTRGRTPGGLTTRKGAQHLQGLKPGCETSAKLLRRVEMREGGNPSSAEGQWRLAHKVAYAHAVFSAKTLDTPLFPCSTLVSTSCLNSVGTRVQPQPPPD